MLSFTVSAFSIQDFFKWLKGEKQVRLSADENGLILYIPFDDSRDDITGNYDTSCRSDACPLQTDGKINNSYKFDGKDDYVKAIDDGQFSFAKGDNYTISAWVNISKKDPRKAFPTIMQKWDDTEPLRVVPFGMSYENATGKIICGMNNGSASISTRSNNVIQENQWNMITCIYNSTDIVIYVNGDFNNKVSYTILSGEVNNNNDIWIGSIGTRYGFLNASIDDIRIYNRALTREEIGNLYAQIQPPLAIGPCPDNQTILRLSAATNAHGALWNNQNYPVKVCYDQTFGKQYTSATGENVHQCKTGNSNLVLELSNETNAHAGNLSSAYQTSICYGDLKCKVKTACNATEKLIVSLSPSENAHLSNSSDYSNKVCCSSAQASQITTEICNNLIDDDNDNLIDCVDIADCSNNNACLQTGNCTIGTTLCADGICRATCTEFTCNNNNQCETGEGCQCADCHGFQDGCATNLTCSFRTNICQQCPSGTLFNSGICIPDNGPSIIITSPTQRQKFRINTDISFNQTSSNLRKNLNITWYFGDRQIGKTPGNCLTTGNCNTTHKYTRQAHYLVKAVAREQGGNRNAEDSVDIFLYKQGINVFAIISNPEKNDVIGNGNVYFNANESYVAKCDLNQCETGKDCYNVQGLYCYDFPRPPQNYKLWFNWTFDNKENLIGTWNDNYDSVVEFNKIFTSPEDEEQMHNATLTVIYET